MSKCLEQKSRNSRFIKQQKAKNSKILKTKNFQLFKIGQDYIRKKVKLKIYKSIEQGVKFYQISEIKKLQQ